MKTIILITLVLCATATGAQTIVKFGTGYSFGKAPVLELEAGYSYKGIMATGGFAAHTNNSSEQHTLFQLNLGGLFAVTDKIHATFQAGYCYQLATVDTKDGYRKELITKVALSHQVSERWHNAHYYVSYGRSGDYSLLTIGVMGLFK